MKSPAAAPLALTHQQRAALETRDASVSLSAGAGCGKTFVLTERYLQAIAPGGEGWNASAALESVAAITFTDAAAREMRARIRQRLRERLATGPPGDVAAWRQLTRRIDAAQISTFHSFCNALLRRFAVEADLDPQFELLDPSAAALMQVEAIDDLLRDRLTQRDDQVLQLAADLEVEGLQDNVFAMLNSLSRLPEAETQRWGVENDEGLILRWQEEFAASIAPRMIAAFGLEPCLRQLTVLADPENARSTRLAAHLSALREDLDRLAATRRAPLSVPEFTARLEAAEQRAKVQGVCKAADWHDPAFHAAFRKAAEKFRGKVQRHPLRFPEDLAAARSAARRGSALLSVTLAARDLLRQRKRDRNQLDYDDLMLRTHSLLTNSLSMGPVRDALKSLRLLMVDEFQDTDPLQVELVRVLCPGYVRSGLFFVGDAKQSIYRFRGAEPSISRALRAELPATSQLALTANFRSQPAVIRFVNGLFAEALDDYEPLEETKPQVTPAPAVEFLWSGASAEGSADADAAEPASDDDGPSDPAAVAKRRCEARWIARRIGQLLAEPLIVADPRQPGGRRPVRPGDFAILLRALSDVALYEEALRDQGLPCHLSGGHAFYAQQEIYDILNLLRAVASLIDQPSLAGALRSPLFALQDETLYWLAETRGSLQAALLHGEPPPQLGPEEAAKFRRAAATIACLRDQKDRLLVADLLQEALARTGYDATLQAEFLGRRKAANLAKLCDMARELDRVSPGDLPGFITQLSEFVTRAPKEALAAVQAEGDVVRLMTVHNAKGLEFPVVIAADLGRKPGGNRGKAVLDRRLGPVVPGKKSKKNNQQDRRVERSGWDLFRWREATEDVAERLRLLYVACTRAADYLVLSAAAADALPASGEPVNDWLRLLDERFDLRSGDFRGEALPGRAPSVRVTLEEPPDCGAGGDSARRPPLEELVAEARALAATASPPPAAAGRRPLSGRWRRGFSFSRLTGELQRTRAGEEDADDEAADEEDRAAPDGAQDRAQPGGGPRWEPFSAAAASSRGWTPRDLGLVVHRVLEHCDFARPAEIRRLCVQAAEAVQAPAAALPAEDLVRRFLATPRAGAVASARQVRRELPFLLPWPAAGSAEPPRHIEGVIDCLYQDASGGWRLLDYKTHKASPGRAADAAARYEIQLYVYAEACRQALGAPLEEVALCFLDSGEELAFSWSTAERAALEQRVTAAVKSLIDRVQPW